MMSDNEILSKISIIVPVYNAGKTLKECVNSIIGQSYHAWELWLIDDGSGDLSGEMCDKFSALDSRIHVVHKENGGVSAARNTGLDNAEGEYVLFVDSDDYLELNALERLVNSAKGTGADIVMFGFYYHFKETNMIKKNVISREFVGNNEDFVSEMFNEVFEKELLNPPWNKLVRRELLLKNSICFMSDFSICEDMIFTVDSLQACCDMVFLEDALYHYIYKREDNLVNRFHPNYHDALQVYVGKVKQYLARNNGSERLQDGICTFYVNQMIAYLKKMYMVSGYEKEREYDELKRICEEKDFRSMVEKYNPRSIKKRIVISCIKHKRYRLLHVLYAEILCRKCLKVI